MLGLTPEERINGYINCTVIFFSKCGTHHVNNIDSRSLALRAVLHLVHTFLSANQMGAMKRHSARAVGQCVGVLMPVARKFLTPDRMEIQIVASQV